MQFQFVCIVALALGANAAQVQVTPVQKVVTLLQGMLEKGKKEKHEEQVAYAESKQFCDDTEVVKKDSIKSEHQRIDSLTATISKQDADELTLTKEIRAVDKDQNTLEGNIAAAIKVRANEKADYDKTHKDYSESVDAIGRAITVLKKRSADKKQASFLQLSALTSLSLIPQHAKNSIDAFLQQDAEATDASEVEAAPEANGYEFQSSGVVDMLKKLQSKFIDERTTLEQEEANLKAASELLIQDLRAQVQQDKRDRSAKGLSRSKAEGIEADARGDKKPEMSSLAGDEKYLGELKADCSMKKSDFEANQAMRSDEIEAIEKAIEIISSGSVAGAADKHLPSFLQKQGSSLVGLRSNLNLESQMQSRVGLFLKTRAMKLNSRVLSAVATRASADPMAKVKKMIKDLVTKLLEEANEEADHKGWCDTELQTNGQTRKEKTDAVQTLSAEVEGLEASISKITDAVSALTQQVSDLDAASAKATDIRNTEKKNNAETVKDAKEAQAAVAQALTVLREFYAKAGEESFLQTAAPYKGQQSANGGVVGMLEVIESDFARLESQTASAEATAQKEYDTFMTDTKVDKASKSEAIEHKSAKKQDEEQTLVNTKKDLEGNQEELDASLEYFEKLKPSCVDSGVSYEDRVARRKEEIASMQEALQIINGEEIA